MTPIRSDLEDLQSYFSNLLGPRVGVAVSDTQGKPQRLYPEEAEAVAKATPARQREFAAGRQAARRAMHAIGWPEAPIPSQKDRSPAWPKGLVGSISHTQTVCVAIVARKEHVKSIGIDVEAQKPIEIDLWPAICTPQELAFISQSSDTDQGQIVTQIFSAKEAFYKWQYPMTGRFLEFHDITITLNATANSFTAKHQSRDLVTDSRFDANGHSHRRNGLIISTVIQTVNTEPI